MANALLKIYHNIVNKWDSAVLMPIHKVVVTAIHMIAITQNPNVLQGFANVVRTYGRTNTKTVT